MAKKKAKTQTKTITRVVQQKAPPTTIRVQTSAARAPAKKTTRRRSSSSGGGGGGSGKKGLQKVMMGSAAGGFVLGLIEKQFPELPSLPVVGRKGTIAILAYMLSDKGGMIGGIARDTAIATAGISGYQFGKEGKVTGEDDDVDGDIAPQVSGIAAQV